MFNRKSIYALNKKDPDAIVYMDANEVIVRLTREDFASEKEFLKWKALSDEDYHASERKLMSMPITRLRWMSYPRKRPPFLPLMWLWSASTRNPSDAEWLPRWFLRSGTS